MSQTKFTVWRWTDPRPGNPYGPTLVQHCEPRAPMPQDWRDGLVRLIEGPPVRLAPTPACPDCGGKSFDLDILVRKTICTNCGWSL